MLLQYRQHRNKKIFSKYQTRYNYNIDFKKITKNVASVKKSDQYFCYFLGLLKSRKKEIETFNTKTPVVQRGKNVSEQVLLQLDNRNFLTL